MAKFNPGFSFDFPDTTQPAQAPWDLTDAIREAGGKPLVSHSRPDQQLPPAKKAKIHAQKQSTHSQEDPDSASDASVQESDQESDQPLPGELDDQLSDRRHSHQEASTRAQPGMSADADYFGAAPEGTSFSAQAFSDLQLSRPLLRACSAVGYTQPTPIQAACIPVALMGRDISGSAVTGSGKTAAFALPILERLLFRNRRVAAIYALILTPTRELAVQVHSMVQRLAQYTDIRTALVVGGLSQQIQASTLRSQPEIVVATPGRLIDHVRNTQSVGLEDIQMLVLDEADRLLDMGFSEEVAEIIRMAPRSRQTMLFSATMTEEVAQLQSLSLNKPVRLAADEKLQAPAQLTQEIVRLKGAKAVAKEACLLSLASGAFRGGQTIIFASTKQQTHRLHLLFRLCGLPSTAELHGNLTQAQRLESLEAFRQGQAAFLLATDVAARGLDILGVRAVINYDAPSTLRSYLHRIGRTARAGKAGRALTMIEDGDRALAKAILKQTGAKLLERSLPAPTVASWSAKVTRCEDKLQAILQGEREERALRKAEMEAQKAANMMEYEDEIQARPARTWFQTEKQKRSRQAQAGAEKQTGSDNTGNNKKAVEKTGAKANKQGRNAEAKKARKDGKSDERKSARDSELAEEMRVAQKGIRAAKARESALKQTGVRPGIARKEALSTGREGSKKQKQPRKSRKGPADKASSGDADLFSGDGRGINPGQGLVSKVYAGGGRSGKLRVQAGVNKAEKNKRRRHGKGAKAFKSKGRHKRR
ncbi:hypothetical protein WJX73_001953 [Symbiochloris irregularis]|uniref:Uncharacterized protein n=1 Tax=Symbiochloris irregularis TaxID=706552 RepID=A0AAW1NPW5_9CHLO